MGFESRRILIVVWSSLLVVACGPPADGSRSITQELKVSGRQTAEIFPSAGLSYFGRVVALRGPFLATTAGGEAGDVVAVHRRNQAGWQLDGLLLGPQADPGSGFASALALDDGVVVVGSPFEAGGAGAAYVYVRTPGGWRLQARLLAPDAGVTTFGRAVAVSGDTAVVSALRLDGTGVAFLLVRSRHAWTPRARLTADDALPGDDLGASVAFDGRTVVLASPRHEGHGAAYLFSRDAAGTWSQEREIDSGDVHAGDGFGRSVAVSGDTVVVGNDVSREGAYLFRRTRAGWVQEAKLVVAEDVEPYCGLGHTVAIDGDTVALGAPWATREGQATAGTVYVFGRDRSGVWTRLAIVDTDDPPVEHEMFGHAVALDGRRLAVSAPEDRDRGPVTGAVYLFQLR